MIQSNKQLLFLKNYKSNKIKILIIQLVIFLSFIIIWEFLANQNIINSFITSSPSIIVKTIYNLLINETLFHHIWVTLSETLISFFITMFISVTISILIYRSDFFSRVIDPYLTIINSLPKVALGPIIIIWVGANKNSIILMAILISLIVSIQSISIGFKNTNQNRIKLLKTFGASEWDIIINAVIPSNYRIIINTCKINIGLCLIGVIMGEFLTSKAGIGYLILYGSQIFNLSLVMSGIIILLLLSIILYGAISYIEKHLDY